MVFIVCLNSTHTPELRDVETWLTGVFHLSLLSSKGQTLCPWGLRGHCLMSHWMCDRRERDSHLPCLQDLCQWGVSCLDGFPVRDRGFLTRMLQVQSRRVPGASCSAEHPSWGRASLAMLGGPGYPQPVPLAPVLPSYSTAGLSTAASQATPSWVLLISFFYKSHSLIMVNNESIFLDLCSFYPNCILTSICIFDPSDDGKKTPFCSDRIKRKSDLRT